MLFATALVGVGLSFGLAGTAVAAAQPAVTAPSNGGVSSMDTFTYGYYKTLGECQNAGQGLPPGTGWTCEQEGSAWVLGVSKQE
jgi:hypothetical protein